jgi:signal peptidase I
MARGFVMLTDEHEEALLVDDGPPRSAFAAIREWGVVLAVALGVALLVRGFLIAPFYIPSTSMVETLQVKDRILVNRLSYRLHPVNRGDVIVFEKPEGSQFGDEVEDLIKRAMCTSTANFSMSPTPSASAPTARPAP